MTDNRHPAGTSIGGRWAPGASSEVEVDDQELGAGQSSLRYAPGGVVIASAPDGRERQFMPGSLGLREVCSACNGSGRAASSDTRPSVCPACNAAGSTGMVFVSESEIEEYVSGSSIEAPTPQERPARQTHRHYGAAVGDEVADVPVTVLRSVPVTQTFRDRKQEARMLILRTQGNELLKVTSRSKAAMASAENGQLRVSGVIAEHTEYRGEPQTRLASPKLSQP